jgi:hypothetical protein
MKSKFSGNLSKLGVKVCEGGRRPMVNTISVAMSKWPTPPLTAIEKDADIYNYKHRNHGYLRLFNPDPVLL